MKKGMNMLVVAIVLMMASASLGLAADDPHKHGAHGDDTKSHAASMDNQIHESNVDDFQMSYQLIDMMAKIKDMANKPEMKNTHHLMVYVKDAHGHALTQAKVGYLIQGPDQAKQKTMCMAMSGGFGADVNFKAKGVYTIQVKVMAGEKTLKDKFEYKVK